MFSAIDRVLQQPTAVAWLLLAAVVALAFIAVCCVIGVLVLAAAAKQMLGRTSFADQAQPLLDKGDLESLIEKCRARLALFNDDASAHYFIGVAFLRKSQYRQALQHLRRIPELQAGWDVAPMIQAVQEKISSEEAPSLQVVSPSPFREQEEDR